MHFVAERSGSNFDGTLIGIYDEYIYSANASEDEIHIYRKKVINSGEWELYWRIMNIHNYCSCCDNGISVAYGIVGDQLFVGSYGVDSSDTHAQLYLFSVNLAISDITYYSVNNEVSDLAYSLCNKCSSSYITALPSNPSELLICQNQVGNSHFSREVRFRTNYLMYKLVFEHGNTFRIQQTCGFSEIRNNIQSNIGIIEFKKIIYAQDGKIAMAHFNEEYGDAIQFTNQLMISDNSDLKCWNTLGFYNTPEGMIGVAVEAGGSSSINVGIYDVEVFTNEEDFLFNGTIRFIKKVSFPLKSVGPGFLSERFILHPKYLIFSCPGRVITYVLDLLSLSESSFCAIMNSSIRPDVNPHFLQSNVGFTQGYVKQLLNIPASSDLVRP